MKKKRVIQQQSSTKEAPKLAGSVDGLKVATPAALRAKHLLTFPKTTDCAKSGFLYSAPGYGGGVMSSNRAAAPTDLFESHPSLSASLEDFENNENPSPVFRVPSHHSGFKSEESDADVASNSSGPWSPPGWRPSDAGSGWYRHQPYAQVSPSPKLRFSASGSRSREASPQYESADEDKEDYTIAANIPLPRGSLSPVKEDSPVRERSPSPAPVNDEDTEKKVKEESVVPDDPNNCA